MRAKNEQSQVVNDVQKWIRKKIRHRKAIKIYRPVLNLREIPFIKKKIKIPGLKKTKIDTAKIPVGFKVDFKKRKITPKYKKFYFEHEIPGTVLDVIEQIGFHTKTDKLKPKVLDKHLHDHGWTIILELPPGKCFREIAEIKEYFQDATNSWVDIEWDSERGRVVVDVFTSDLPTSIGFEWDPTPWLEKMEIPIPIGHTYKLKPLVIDLAELPHFLIGGLTKFGKTNFIRMLLHCILPYCYIGVIDLKRVSFGYLNQHCKIAKTEEDALKMLELLSKEHDRRTKLLEKAGAENVQEYPKREDMPYLCLIIDELAEVKSDDAFYYLDRLVRLARATGIHIIAATQRPSVKVLDGDIRSQFDGRLSFRVSTATDSRIILDSSHAAYLKTIKGRAIYRHGVDFHEVQTMYLPKAQAEKMLSTGTGPDWGWYREPETKRLPPR